MIVNLSGVMLMKSSTFVADTKSAIALTLLIASSIFSSILYFIVLFVNEIITTAKKKRLKNVIKVDKTTQQHSLLIKEMNPDKRGPEQGPSDFGSKTHHNQEAGSPQPVPTSNESGCSRPVSESKSHFTTSHITGSNWCEDCRLTGAAEGFEGKR